MKSPNIIKINQTWNINDIAWFAEYPDTLPCLVKLAAHYTERGHKAELQVNPAPPVMACVPFKPGTNQLDWNMADTLAYKNPLILAKTESECIDQYNKALDADIKKENLRHTKRITKLEARRLYKKDK